MKEIFVERREKNLRIAIMKNGNLQEMIVEEEKNGPVIGQIYKGKIKNIIGATNSIFVDIGLKKEAYLYYSNELKHQGVKKGDDIVVEIIKEPIGGKGAKVTTNFALPSKYMVLESKGHGVEFSSRFKDEVKKALIEAELKETDKGKLIIRTEASNVSIEELNHEKNVLYREYEEILRKMKYSTHLGKIYGNNITLNKVLRDKIDLEPVKVILDNEKDYEFAKWFLKGENNVTIELYTELRGIFEKNNIEKELIKLRHNKVVLPCGGNIIIEKTEAMYVIDVNSGKNIKERNFEETILKTNLEAATEIGKQILIRNLSGIIIVDFIDMRDKSQKSKVLKALKEALNEDIGNIKIFPFTDLDLIQISRKRRGKSIYEYLEEKCPLCNGSGSLLKLSYLEELIKEEITRYYNENGIKEFLIEIEEVYKSRIQGDILSFLKNIDGLDKEIYINYIEGMENYRIEPIIFKNQKANISEYLIRL
ncbi:MAG: Rne/Rng family ribonuclease [Clostridiales bacterium]|nr:Rne/Rng family ribonuclease [Clostridiales bacterium]